MTMDDFHYAEADIPADRCARSGRQVEDGPVSGASAASLVSIPIRRAPAAEELEEPDPAPAPGPAQPEDLIGYWEGARGERRFPAPADLDETVLAKYATQCFLMRCLPGGQFQQVDRVLRSRMFDFDWFDDNAAMILEWLHNLGNHAVRLGIPIEEGESFPIRGGTVRCVGTVLPLSQEGHAIDRLLCCLSTEAAG